MLISPDIARLAVSGAVITHCRLPAWEAGDYESGSATSLIGLPPTRRSCVLEGGGGPMERMVDAASEIITGGELMGWLRVMDPSDLIEVSADAPFRAGVADEMSALSASDLGDLSGAQGPTAWAIVAQVRACARTALSVRCLGRSSWSRRWCATSTATCS